MGGLTPPSNTGADTVYCGPTQPQNTQRLSRLYGRLFRARKWVPALLGF